MNLTLSTRFRKYFDSEFPINFDWVPACRLAGAMGPTICSSFIKTILGSWLTSRRLQRPAASC
eukprot:5309855-Karenia_brevis.AAC.1